jgi:hypothetical protein
MNKLVSISSIAAVILFAGNAEAIPFGPINSIHSGLTVPLADGCGFNRYRDSRGICRRKYVLERYPGKRPLYGACSGVNSHRVCNLYGQCWMVCD